MYSVNDLATWQSTYKRVDDEYISDPLTEVFPSKFEFNEDLNNTICFWSGNICNLICDAIVNATEEHYTDRKGISEKIYAAAGPKLEEEVIQRAIESNPSNNTTGCRTGDAIITDAYRLPCKKIIHTVGPRYNAKYSTAAENMLHLCYRTCLQTLVENNLRTIAFSCIHSEKKNYTAFHGAPIALRTIRRFLERYPGKIDKVVLVMPSPEISSVYYSQLVLYFPRSFVEEQQAVDLLPEDTGNEYGETVCPERVIRIASSLGSTAVSSFSSLNRFPMHLDSRRSNSFFISSLSCKTDDNVDTSAVVKPTSSNGFCRVSVISGTSGLAYPNEAFTIMHADFDTERQQNVVLTEQDSIIIFQRYLKQALSDNFSDVEGMKVIFRCGFDVTNRPTVAIVGCRITDESSYDRLLMYFIKVLNPICDKDYTIVYFHSRLRHKPAFSWLRKAYSILPLKYKKNLKALYVVHPTVWLNFAIAFLKPFVSDKFWSKMYMIEDIRRLYEFIPHDAISIPEEILQYNYDMYGDSAVFSPKRASKKIFTNNYQQL